MSDVGAIEAVYAAIFGLLSLGAVIHAARSDRGYAPAIALVVTMLMAVALTRETFRLLRLVAFALFIGGPLLWFVSAWLLRNTRRWVAWSYAAVATLLVGLGADAFLVEPGRLQLSRITVTNPKVRQPICVALVADIQFDHFGSHERRALDSVKAAAPDIVAFAGDYVQEANQDIYDSEGRAFGDYIRKIGLQAPLGMFAVRGNVEADRWRTIFLGLPVQVAEKSSTAQSADGSIAISLLSLDDSFNSRMTIAEDPSNRFHIVLGHAPDYALGEVHADLLLAGHTHGGQVQVPLWGPLITYSAVPRRWAAGVTQLPAERTLIVSRGIGMERGAAPRLRFLCPPEVIVIDLLPP